MNWKKNNMIDWMIFSCIVMLKICILVALCTMHHEHDPDEQVVESTYKKRLVYHISGKK